VCVCVCVSQDPGRVWKGKKMPGHMGLKRVTMDGLKVGASLVLFPVEPVVVVVPHPVCRLRGLAAVQD
jgi:ribosomal protein L3